jgi:hypothetical protein
VAGRQEGCRGCSRDSLCCSWNRRCLGRAKIGRGGCACRRYRCGLVRRSSSDGFSSGGFGLPGHRFRLATGPNGFAASVCYYHRALQLSRLGCRLRHRFGFSLGWHRIGRGRRRKCLGWRWFNNYRWWCGDYRRRRRWCGCCGLSNLLLLLPAVDDRRALPRRGWWLLLCGGGLFLCPSLVGAEDEGEEAQDEGHH